MDQKDEWMKFLKAFEKGDDAAIAFLPKMKDEENIEAAKRRLFPSRPARNINYMDAEALRHQKMMWNDSGFMPKLGDRKMGYR